MKSINSPHNIFRESLGQEFFRFPTGTRAVQKGPAGGGMGTGAQSDKELGRLRAGAEQGKQMLLLGARRNADLSLKGFRACWYHSLQAVGL